MLLAFVIMMVKIVFIIIYTGIHAFITLPIPYYKNTKHDVRIILQTVYECC